MNADLQKMCDALQVENLKDVLTDDDVLELIETGSVTACGWVLSLQADKNQLTDDEGHTTK